MDRNLINTRPNDRSNLNTIAFVGTEIDDLRNKVLSVWLGRVVITITAQKYGLDVLPRPGYQSYQQRATLELADAQGNVDSLSLFRTGRELPDRRHLQQFGACVFSARNEPLTYKAGARSYYNIFWPDPNQEPSFSAYFQTLGVSRWKDGVLQPRMSPAVAVQQPQDWATSRPSHEEIAFDERGEDGAIILPCGLDKVGSIESTEKVRARCIEGAVYHPSREEELRLVLHLTTEG